MNQTKLTPFFRFGCIVQSPWETLAIGHMKIDFVSHMATQRNSVFRDRAALQKAPASRRANPAEGGVRCVRRSDCGMKRNAEDGLYPKPPLSVIFDARIHHSIRQL